MSDPTERAAVLMPSDLAELQSESFGQALTVAGRVVHVGDQNCTIADACGAATVHGAPNRPVNPGDLLTCEVGWVAPRWRLLRVDAIQRNPEPTGFGDATRLTGSRGRRLVFASRARRLIREYFEAGGFVEVETPHLVPCPGLDAHVQSLGAVDVASRRRHLITSPEFAMKRLLTSGLPRIYQLARCFRGEERGPWHEPEFTMLEWYRAYADWEDTMRDTEELVRRVFSAARNAGWNEAPKLPSTPFLRLTVDEAFARFAQEPDAATLATEDEARFFELLVDRVEPGLAALDQPVFLTHFPLSQAALARPSAQHPTSAERYELFFRGVELCNGFGELTDATVQRSRFEAERERRRRTGEVVYELDERFLGALAEGMPPSSGNALGVDRLIALACGAECLADVLAFSVDEI